MRTPSAKAKPTPSLRSVISATKKLWRQYHLTYDQTRYVAKEVRRALAVERPKTRKRVVARLSREEAERLIKHAYRMKGERGLLIKTLFQTGARVSEFVNLTAEDVVTVQVVKTGITPQLATSERLREAETEPRHHAGPRHTPR